MIISIAQPYYSKVGKVFYSSKCGITGRIIGSLSKTSARYELAL